MPLLWQGSGNRSSWTWETNFPASKRVQSIVQRNGNHSFVFTNAPLDYEWFASEDGLTWKKAFATTGERRLIREHRFAHSKKVTGLRFVVTKSNGLFPALQSVELFEHPPKIQWSVIVNTTHELKLPTHGREFIPLIKKAEPEMAVQQINLENFNPVFLNQLPKPVCAFLSGNFKDWCEVDRERWRGTQEVLRRKQLPIWASCGGAQGLAILATAGVDKPWDCPHCRDDRKPLIPVYSHIGHKASKPCGDYSSCIFEKGPYSIKQAGHDPVFQGLEPEFNVMQSHCGQINFAPKGWDVIAFGGEKSLTKIQCLRLRGTLIYAAQFHIEMPGTSENSQTIMQNFVKLAAGGSNER
jgi:hypothetical protein